MSVSILECLMNAEHNLTVGHPVIRPLAREQLHNAYELICNRRGLDDNQRTYLKDMLKHVWLWNDKKRETSLARAETLHNKIKG